MTGGYFDGEPVIYIAVQIDGTNERHIIKYNSLQNQFKFMGTAPTNMFMRNSIEVSKIDQNRLWLGGVNCYTSIDGGMTWELINQWYAYYQDVLNKLHADIPSINAFKIADNKEVIFINTDGGTYRSIGDNYILKNISLKGLNVSQYYSIYSYSGDEGNYIYAGAQDQGFQFGLVNGKLPVDMVQSISGDYGNLSSGNNGNALWMVYPGFALIYPDLPNNTSSVTWDFVGKYENRVWMPPVVAIPGRPSDAIIAPGGSNNNSTLWRLEYSKNFIYPYEMPFVFDEQEPGNDVSAIAISELDTNYYYATTKLGRFYYSTDAGKTWDYNKDDTGIGYNYLHGSAILPSKLNLGTVYFAGSGYSNPGVYVTYDNGINVEALGENMPKVFFYSLAASADELAIFAATSVGPYVYLKGINRWYSMMSLDSPEQVYWSVNFIPEDNVVRFATYGRGIWDFQIDKINNVFNEQNNANISAVEVFPNPTTQFVQINLSNIGNKNISARIFDIDGNLVCNVVNGNSYNDNYSYTWDLTNFAGIPVANGTYILVYVIDGLNNYQKINVAR